MWIGILQMQEYSQKILKHERKAPVNFSCTMTLMELKETMTFIYKTSDFQVAEC